MEIYPWGVFFMKLRVSVALLLLAAVFALVGFRTYEIGAEAVDAAYSGGSKTIDIAEIRGTVYDCNMNPITNAETEYTAAAKPTQKAVAALKKVLTYDAFKAVSDRMLSGNPVTVSVKNAACECSDVKVISYPKRYSSVFACHLIGYLGSSGQGISGVESAFNELLASYSYDISVRFQSDAQSRVLLGEEIEVNSGAAFGGIALTVDADIQRIAENALDEAGVECGAAVVIDIESGAIRASASRPAFDPDNIAESLENKNSPLINRAFLPFTVGSVFKPVVAAAALENGVKSFEYECTGSVTLNGVTFNCHEENGHGVIGMKDAVAYSCNTYFIALARKIGADAIIETAADFGFGKETVFADGIKSSGGNLPSADELDSQAAIANIAFGQGALTATPVQICAAMASIARGGIYIEPWLIKGEVNADGKLINRVYNENKTRIVSEKTADILKEYLLAVVEQGSGRRAKSEAVTCGGKTATAQTGNVENGEEIYNAWFAGYFPADNPRYAVAILKEDGGEGAVSCAPIFKTVAEEITELENR